MQKLLERFYNACKQSPLVDVSYGHVIVNDSHGKHIGNHYVVLRTGFSTIDHNPGDLPPDAPKDAHARINLDFNVTEIKGHKLKISEIYDDLVSLNPPYSYLKKRCSYMMYDLKPAFPNVKLDPSNDGFCTMIYAKDFKSDTLAPSGARKISQLIQFIVQMHLIDDYCGDRDYD